MKGVLLLVGLAWAGLIGHREEEAPPPDPAVLEGERQRLTEDMAQLAQRGNWNAVEELYQRCASLGVPLAYDDYLLGAQAARAIGNAAAVHERLRAALRLNASREVVDWLWSLDSNYGYVDIRVNPPRGVELEAEQTPFAPDARAAYEFARARLAEDGSFEGLLPAGDYRLLDRSFHVEPGNSLSLELHLHGRRRPSVAPDGERAGP